MLSFREKLFRQKNKFFYRFPDTPGMVEKIKTHFKGLAQIEDKITGMPAINQKGLLKNRNISESTRKHL